MPDVHKLDESLIQLIAAGEVVDRPAAVLKELLENSLDAHARRIAVELEEGGKRLIAVSDDGEGMHGTDALLALERHATSKLRRREDLDEIATLGFRGEALPAIAAVSRLELTTAAASGGEGVRVRVEGSAAPRVAPAARSAGTTVIVRDLFFATPARRKFLRSEATELARLIDVVTDAALAHPQVAFELRSGGRRLLGLPPCEGVDARLAAIYGVEYASSLLPVAGTSSLRRISGFTQRPDACGRGRRRQLLFVGARPIHDRALGQAVFRGYASTIPAGAYPHFFLFLDVPPREVDVNVHPAKREVRFRDPEALFGFVQAAVRDALGGLSAAPRLGRRGGFRRVTARANGERDSSLVRAVGGSAAEELEEPAGPSSGTRGFREGGAKYRTERAGPADGRGLADQLGLFLNARRSGITAGAAEIESRGPRLWQLHDTFILAQTRSGLAVVDQHSAHERVLYERILVAFEEGPPASQELVFPRTYRLGPVEWQSWEESQGLFTRLGFRLEPFGERTLALRAVPVLAGKFQPEDSFVELLGDLAGPGTGEPNRHARLARSLACRGAVKAGQPLAYEEMAQLCDDLFATSLPTADVHGRPAVVQITLEELTRRFGRA